MGKSHESNIGNQDEIGNISDEMKLKIKGIEDKIRDAEIDLEAAGKKEAKGIAKKIKKLEKQLSDANGLSTILKTKPVEDTPAVDSVPANETIIQTTSDNVALKDTGNIGNNSENLDKKTSGAQALENLSRKELENKFIELNEIGRERGARIRELATNGDPENIRPGLITEQEEGYQEYLKYKERLEESAAVSVNSEYQPKPREVNQDIRKIAESKTQEPVEELRNTREKLKNEYKKEVKPENLSDDKDAKIIELEKENAGLKEAVKTEQLNTVEAEARLTEFKSVLDNLEKTLQEKINAIPEKEAGKLEKIWKFVNKKEVKFAIGVGLITGATIATGGGALVGAWLHLPYGLGIAGLGGTSNLTTALLGSAFASSAYGSKLKEGFQQNMKELLDVAKNEKEFVSSEASAETPVIKEGFLEKWKNRILGGKKEETETAEKPEMDTDEFHTKLLGMIDALRSREDFEEIISFMENNKEIEKISQDNMYSEYESIFDLKEYTPEISDRYDNYLKKDIEKIENMEDSKEKEILIDLFYKIKGRHEANKYNITGEELKIDKIDFGRELTSDEKKQSRLDAEKYGIDFIGGGEEQEKKEENNEDSVYMEIVKKESEIFKKFAEDFKSKKKTGKDVFDYLGELSAVYFKDKSKYVTVFFAEIENQEKLSTNKFNDLKINLIDSMIDYLREEGKEDQKLKAKQFTTLLFPWSGAKIAYSYAGKKENVEWLDWKHRAL